MMMMKRLLIAASIAGIAAATVAYFLWNKPHRDIASEDAAFSLTADELFDAFDADEDAANAKFLDKVVEVSGTVTDVQPNDAGQPVITLKPENAMLGGVSATMQEAGEASVAEGQAITVKCRCTGFLMDVVLINCSLK